MTAHYVELAPAGARRRRRERRRPAGRGGGRPARRGGDDGHHGGAAAGRRRAARGRPVGGAARPNDSAVTVAVRDGVIVAVWPGYLDAHRGRGDRRRLDHHRRPPVRPRHRRGARVGRADEPADPLRRGPDEPGVVRDDEPGRRRRAHQHRPRGRSTSSSASWSTPPASTPRLGARGRGGRQPDHAPPRARHRPDAARAGAVRAGDRPCGRRAGRRARARPAVRARSTPDRASPGTSAPTPPRPCSPRDRTAASGCSSSSTSAPTPRSSSATPDASSPRRARPDPAFEGAQISSGPAGDGRGDRAGAHRSGHAGAAAAR